MSMAPGGALGAGSEAPPLDPLAPENLVRLHEDEAVRLRFDQQNRAALPLLLFAFTLVGTGESIAALDGDGGFLLAVGLFQLAVSLALFLLVRRAVPGRRRRLRSRRLDAFAARVTARVRGLAIAALLGEFALATLFTSGAFAAAGDGTPPPWTFVMPWLVLGFRISLPELLLVHGGLYAIVVLERLLTPADLSDGDAMAALVGALVINAIALGLGAMLARRLRRRFLPDWRRARDGAVEQRRMRQELEYAREIQLSMLPREAPRRPWLDVASLSLPASEVGGDYFDFFPLPDGGLAVAVGDVAGHGMASGIALAGLRSGLALLGEDLHDPGRVMERLDRMVRQTARRRLLVALSLLVFEPGGRSARLCTAGLPPLLVRRASGGAVEAMGAPALPLGTRLSQPFEPTFVRLEPGDLLMLASDGVYELGGEDPFGMERLGAVFAQIPDGTAAEARDAVLRELWTFKGDAPQSDDITLVVMRVVAPAADQASSGSPSP